MTEKYGSEIVDTLIIFIITDAHENRKKMTEFDFSSIPIVIEESAQPLQETQGLKFEKKTDIGIYEDSVNDVDHEDKKHFIYQSISTFDEFIPSPTEEVHEGKKAEYYPVKSVSCAMCSKPFVSTDDLKKHVEAFHDFLRCGTCNANFKKESQIKRHILQKHEGKGAIIKTNDMTYKKYDMANPDLESVQGNGIINLSKDVHEVKNPQNSVMSKPCAVCEKEFDAYDKLIRHVEANHHYVTCGTCNSGFKIIDRLRTHIAKKHDGKGFIIQNKFDVENYLTSLRKEALNNDVIKEVHEVNRPQHSETSKACAVCDKEFKTYDKLIKHVETFHHYVTCGTCKSTFKTVDNLRTHIENKHDGKGFIMQNKFDVEHYLTSIKKDALENPLSEGECLECAVCNKCFSSKQLLMKHYTQAHEGNQPLEGFALSFFGNQLSSEKKNPAKETFGAGVEFTHDRKSDVHERKQPKEIGNKHVGKEFIMQNQFDVEHYLTSLKKKALQNDVLKEVHDVNNSEVLEQNHFKMSENAATDSGDLGDSGAYKKENQSERVHEEKKQLDCGICELPFSSKERVKTHIQAVHVNASINVVKKPEFSVNSFSCPVCEKSYGRYGSLQYHIQANHDFVKCGACNFNFKTIVEFNAHNVRVHEGTGLVLINQWKQFHLYRPYLDLKSEKTFTCPDCFETLEGCEKLREHYLSIHECNSSETFVSVTGTDLNATKKQAITADREVKKNVATAHEVQKLKCDFCYATFKSTSHLMRHLSHAHMEKKLYSCTDCNAEFPGKDTLQIHYHTTHEKPHQCQICAKRFADKEKLSNHVKTHSKQMKKKYVVHEEKEPIIDGKVYVDEGKEYCLEGKQYDYEAKEYILEGKEHVQVHEGKQLEIVEHALEEKEYVCIECNAKFPKEDTLQIHYHITHEKPHQCQICAERFAEKVELSNHVITHNKNKLLRNYHNIDFQAKKKQAVVDHEEKEPIESFTQVKNHFEKGHGVTMQDKSFMSIVEGPVHSANNEVHEVKKREPEFVYEANEYIHEGKVFVHAGQDYYTEEKETHEEKEPIFDEDNLIYEEIVSNFEPEDLHYKGNSTHESIESAYKTTESVNEGKSHVFEAKNHTQKGRNTPNEVKNSITQFSSPQLPSPLLPKYTESIRANPDGTFSCTICNAVQKHQRNLARHIQTVHEGLKPFECTVCQRCFSSKQVLKRHFQSVHEGNGKPKWMPPRYQNANHLTNTMKLQSTEVERSLGISVKKPKVHEEKKQDHQFQCDFCEMFLPNSQVLDAHMKQFHDTETQRLLENETENQGFPEFLTSDASLINQKISSKELAKAGKRKRKTYQCNLCSRIFANKITLTKHIKKIHVDTAADGNSFGANISVKQSDLKLNGEIQGQNETYLCEPCNMMFISEEKFMEHSITVHNEQPENIEIKQAEDLTVHEEENPYLCGLCNICFSSQEQFKIHFETMHENKNHENIGSEFTTIQKKEESFLCQPCNLCFSSEKKFQDHFQRTHGEVNNKSDDYKTSKAPEVKDPFLCGPCNIGFTSEDIFKDHIKYVHEERKDEIENSLNSLTRNSNEEWKIKAENQSLAYTGRKSITCCYCDERFPTIETLTQHSISVHEGKKIYYCPICDSTFSQKQNLIEHVRSVHDNKMDQIQCCYCEDTFFRLQDLKAHSVTSHQGRKCFYCSVCDTVFSQIKDLHVHVAFAHMTKLQNGIQSERFQCHLCEDYLVYPYKIPLKRHLQEIHGLETSLTKINVNQDADKLCNVKKEIYNDEIAGKTPKDLNNQDFGHQENTKKRALDTGVEEIYNNKSCNFEQYNSNKKLKLEEEISGDGFQQKLSIALPQLPTQPLPLLALNSLTTNNEISPTRLILTEATPNLSHSTQIIHQPLAISTVLPQLPTQPLPLMSLNSPITSSEINFPKESIPLTDSVNDIHDIGSENMTTMPNGNIVYSLPYGWKKICRKRNDNRNWDIHVTAPNGKRLRSSVKIKEYLSLNPGIQCDLKVTNTNRPNQYSSKNALIVYEEKTETNGIKDPNRSNSRSSDMEENNGIRKMQQCLHCLALFHSKEILDYHVANNQCDVNNQDFLNYHNNAAANDGKKYQCNICQYKTERKSDLKRHLQRVHKEKENGILNPGIQCDLKVTNTNRPNQYSSKEKLNEKTENNGINQNISNAQFYCFQCSETFPTQDFLKYHISSVHDEKKHQCNICDYKTKDKSNLTKHIKSVHIDFATVHDEKMHQCSICHYKTTDKSNLTKHIKSVHKEQEHIPAIQDIKQEFASNDDKKSFSKLPYPEPANANSVLPKFVSENYGFDDKYEVNNQSKQLWSKPAVKGYFEGKNTIQTKTHCFYCEATFKTIADLTEHCMLSHVGKKCFYCSICYSVFPQRQNLDTHLEQLHKLNQAGRLDAMVDSVIDAATLNQTKNDQNISVHEEKQQFQCEVCELPFLTKQRLDIHISTVHVKTKVIETNISPSDQIDAQNFDGNAVNRMKKIRLEKDNSEENLSIKEISERIGSSINIQSEEVEMVSENYFDEKSQNFRSDVNLNSELRQKIDQEPQDCKSNFEIDEFQLAKDCIDFQPIVLLSKLDSVLTEA